jgi:chloramphenicol O-acetyltransferase
MKFNQYLELNEILKKDNLTLNELLDNPQKLNEGVLKSIIAGLAVGFGLIFGKRLKSWGIKSIYLSKLNKKYEIFTKMLIGKLDKFFIKSAKFRKDIIAKIEHLKTINTEQAKNELDNLIELRNQHRYRVTKQIINYAEDILKLKTKQVFKSINEVKSLRESHKDALMIYWKTLTMDLAQDMFTAAINKNADLNEEIIKKYKEKITDDKEEYAEQIQKIGKKIKEEDKLKNNDGEITFEKIEDNIKDLAHEKSSIDEDALKRKLRAIWRDTQKLKTREEKKEIFNDLKNYFDDSLLKEVLELKTKNIQPSGLKTGDEL